MDMTPTEDSYADVVISLGDLLAKVETLKIMVELDRARFDELAQRLEEAIAREAADPSCQDGACRQWVRRPEQTA